MKRFLHTCVHCEATFVYDIQDVYSRIWDRDQEVYLECPYCHELAGRRCSGEGILESASEHDKEYWHLLPFDSIKPPGFSY